MAIEATGLIVEIPPQATAEQEGPFFGVHSGVITGVYNLDNWLFVHNLLKSTVACKFIDPVFGQFTLWNAAVWFQETGVKLDEGAAAQLGELSCPPRQLLSGEIFLALYPCGTTIIYHDRNIIVPYSGCEPQSNQVLMMSRAFGNNGTANTSNNTGNPNQPDDPGAGVALTTSLQLTTATGNLPVTHPSIPRTIASTDLRPPSSQPPTWASCSGSNTWASYQSTYAASPTMTMSSPERSPKRLPTDSQLLSSQLEQHPGSQMSTSSSQQFPSSASLDGQLQIVMRKARHCIRILSNMCNKDPKVESWVCTEVILYLLASGDFTADGLTDIINAAADLVLLHNNM
ncbi:hypothetical protein RHS04_08976 [Rhizoctonia solani]|uniref:Uncharacterized protein n=1 Tax=Rhizoctonia solani TaxID=456999 RepID=A0A8H7GZH3_9AGAM|nr:hypothetical protein RHS04_08976 [Rhizoctonia solani]